MCFFQGCIRTGVELLFGFIEYICIAMNKMLFWASCLIISLLTISCQREKNNVTMKDYYESVVKEISSPQYYGRSLYNGGIFKSADFIINQLAMSGIEPCVFQAKRENLPEVVGIFGPVGTVLEEEVSKIYPKENEEKERYFQRFTFPYNTFRGEAVFIVDGKVSVHAPGESIKDIIPSGAPA